GVNAALHPGVRATRTGDVWTLDGEKPSVPAAHVAHAILVPAQTDDGPKVFVVEAGAAGLGQEIAETTDRSLVGHLTFDGVSAEVLGDEASGEQTLLALFDLALLGL